MNPDIVDEQLDESASAFVRRELAVDTKKRVVFLPKVCEVYRNDFGPDSLSVLNACMAGLDEGTAITIREMTVDGNVAIRYRQAADEYHSSLTLREQGGDPPSFSDIDRVHTSVSQSFSDEF